MKAFKFGFCKKKWFSQHEHRSLHVRSVHKDVKTQRSKKNIKIIHEIE